MQPTHGDRILLTGFGFTGFRSFFRSPAHVGPLSAVNVVAGQNNSGKSNVLRFAQQVLGSVHAERPGETPRYKPLQQLDVPRSETRDSFTLQLFMRGEYATGSSYGELPQWLARLAEFWRSAKGGEGLLALQPNDGAEVLQPSDGDIDVVIRHWSQWAHSSYQAALNALGGGIVDQRDVARRLLLHLLPNPLTPPVATIGASRRVGADAASVSSENAPSSVLEGAGLIERLADWQNPEHETFDEDRQRLAAVTRFVRHILSDDTIELRVPKSRSTVLLRNGHRTLPLSSLGSGVKQVLVLVTAATSVDQTLVCLEEHETHRRDVVAYY